MTIKLLNGKLLLAIVCLLLFSAVGYAQPPTQAEIAERMQSPARQATTKATAKAMDRSFWNGQGTGLMAHLVVNDPDIRAAWGITDEQFEQFDNIRGNLVAQMMRSPEHQKFMEEMQAIQDPNDPLMLNANEETLAKYQDLHEKMNSWGMNAMFDALNNALTSEQKRKMNEALLASIGEIPTISPSMFEVLHLTDAQKQQMETIKKDLEPEFEKHLEMLANSRWVLTQKMDVESAKHSEASDDPNVMQRRGETIMKNLMADPEYKRISEEIQMRGKAFTTQFQVKMFDVLTDEQWARMLNLIDNPPEHALIFRKKLKGQEDEQEKAGGYIPGPGAWQPGSSAIPEQYRQERNSRRPFPRGENPSPSPRGRGDVVWEA